jgi:hypothetical protein
VTQSDLGPTRGPFDHNERLSVGSERRCAGRAQSVRIACVNWPLMAQPAFFIESRSSGARRAEQHAAAREFEDGVHDGAGTQEESRAWPKLKLCGLRLEGARYRGIDDARNIARMLPWIVGERRIERAPRPPTRSD